VKPIIKILTLIFVLGGVFCFSQKNLAFASSTNGTIDSTYKYAWSENIGWINFGTTNGNLHITDPILTGYAWSDNYGWINLNPATSGVKNDGEGNLSGYAWGENLGWINFSGVTINSSGVFGGSASGGNSGQISFNCANCTVKTDWRPASARPVAASLGGGIPGSASGGVSVPEPKVLSVIERISEILKPWVPEFLKPKPPEIKPPEVPIEELVPKKAPLAFQGKWQFLTYTRKNLLFTKLTLAPLPKEFRVLVKKFPELEKTFREAGIAKFFDVEKLRTVKLTLPGLTKKVGLPMAKIESGKFALLAGVPIAKLSARAKQQLPSEIVFAKTGGELIDFNITLSVTEKGEPQQKISTISGKPLQLVVKPDKPVKSVKGYVVFKSKASRPTSLEILSNSLLASVIFANPVFAKQQEKPVRVEEKLVLLEFEYTDPDGDGIYTAEIQVPVIEGEYEIITVMDFEDPELGKKEIRLVTVVDPEGYIYEKDGDKETRIPGAIVSIFWLNSETKQYELWSAKEYQQENPQTTDVRGTYSFLVPEGFYYLKVETPGYLVYDGKPFQVKEGSGVHINIELKTKYWWLKIVDWKTTLLAAVVILLLYNFYRDKIREKLMGKS